MKKQNQLGINPSTASNRLVKDLLFKFAVESGHKCFQCNGELDRKTFSIEHKVPWLDSEDPLRLYFDTDNIAFSHTSCNSKAARREITSVCGTNSKYSSGGCRCDLCREAHSLHKRGNYNPQIRRDKYQSKGY